MVMRTGLLIVDCIFSKFKEPTKKLYLWVLDYAVPISQLSTKKCKFKKRPRAI